MPRVRAVAGLSMLAAACLLGTPAGKFEPARGPRGVTAELRLVERGHLQGELLAVAESALVVRTSVITVVRYQSLRVGVFRQVGTVSFGGRAPANRDRERLRRVSRFPQGLSPELLQRLLQAYGQAEPAVY